MSTPLRKFNTSDIVNIVSENKGGNKFSDRTQAKIFIRWFKQMIDNERENLGMYFADDAILEWFGKTIKTRQKITSFLRYNMHCSRHDFTTVQNIAKIVQSRLDKLVRYKDTVLASPLGDGVRTRKRLWQSRGRSPEWAEGCQPVDERSENKKIKSNYVVPMDEDHNIDEVDMKLELNDKGDGVLRNKNKFALATPPYIELGQGDCIPSTSGTNLKESREVLHTQLPKLAVEGNGFIEFMRSKNDRDIDTIMWDRKCKVQISYSPHPLNAEEYIIWALCYSDENKCRRNLLSDFDEIAKEEEVEKKRERW